MVNEAGFPLEIMSKRDPNFTAEVRKYLMNILGCSLFSTAHHPETDGLAERSIHTLGGIIREYSSFGMTCTDHYEGFEHNWGTTLPVLEYTYDKENFILVRKRVDIKQPLVTGN